MKYIRSIFIAVTCLFLIYYGLPFLRDVYQTVKTRNALLRQKADAVHAFLQRNADESGQQFNIDNMEVKFVDKDGMLLQINWVKPSP